MEMFAKTSDIQKHSTELKIKSHHQGKLQAVFKLSPLQPILSIQKDGIPEPWSDLTQHMLSGLTINVEELQDTHGTSLDVRVEQANSVQHLKKSTEMHKYIHACRGIWSISATCVMEQLSFLSSIYPFNILRPF